MTVRRFEASSYRIGMDEVSNGPFVLYRAYEAMKEERDALRAQLAGYLAGGMQRHPHDGELREHIEGALSTTTEALAAARRERDEARAELRRARDVIAAGNRCINRELVETRKDAALGRAVREACARFVDVDDIALTDSKTIGHCPSIRIVNIIDPWQHRLLSDICEAIAKDREGAPPPPECATCDELRTRLARAEAKGALEALERAEKRIDDELSGYGLARHGGPDSFDEAMAEGRDAASLIVHEEAARWREASNA